MLQPAAIDGLAFARSAAVLEGWLGIEALPRLAHSGCSRLSLHYVLTGEINARGKPGLRLALDGTARLECQRCLNHLDFPLQIETQLELASSEAEIAAADDDIERIVAAREMRIATLVEDEVLLALPMAPKHERCGTTAELGMNAESSASSRSRRTLNR